MFEFSGLSDDKELMPFFFMFFLLVYMVTIIGNLGMVAIVYAFSSLHTPMYFFLSSLSLVDLFYSSVITPNMLFNFFSARKSISFLGCALQLYFFCALASTEIILLSTMSYDRYVAICHPLHYTLIMTKKKCFGLVLFFTSLSFLQSIAHVCCVFSLPFCGSNFIDHFYCDIPPLLKLSCSTNSLRRQKAFSTCSSHIICVLTFFTAIFFTYLRPHSGAFEIQDKVASIFYTTMTPMLNPLIYSLRNQEVKRILVQAMQKSRWFR
ncbi:olfactory receptor 5G9-like [Pyxicephalus adspersus]|uniref:olfactory receptor 5G9-like n=1 Tax=Pyxicephalus adspersus TaxID=30357 RepID=UPI003B5A12E7